MNAFNIVQTWNEAVDGKAVTLSNSTDDTVQTLHFELHKDGTFDTSVADYNYKPVTFLKVAKIFWRCLQNWLDGMWGPAVYAETKLTRNQMIALHDWLGAALYDPAHAPVGYETVLPDNKPEAVVDPIGEASGTQTT